MKIDEARKILDSQWLRYHSPINLDGKTIEYRLVEENDDRFHFDIYVMPDNELADSVWFVDKKTGECGINWQPLEVK
jgi:hypothetical protein